MKFVTIALVLLMGLPAAAMAGESESSTVHIYRVSDEGFARTVDFYMLNGKELIGQLETGGVVSLDLEPGTHTLRSNLDRSGTLTVTVTDGEPVFIATSIVRKKGRFTTEFSQVEPTVAAASSPKLAQLQARQSE